MGASKILVVDDQPINVQLLKRKLEREGMIVASAYSAWWWATLTSLKLTMRSRNW